MYRTILVDLPPAVDAFTVLVDDCYTIVLNASHSHDQHLKAYEHEVKHILNGDFEKKSPVGLIEFFAHKE